MGKKYCAVRTCSSSSSSLSTSAEPVTFHQLPKNEDADGWNNFLMETNGEYEEPGSSVVCSKHFLPCCFTGTLHRRRIAQGHYPTQLEGKTINAANRCPPIGAMTEMEAAEQTITDLKLQLKTAEGQIQKNRKTMKHYQHENRMLKQSLQRNEDASKKKRSAEEAFGKEIRDMQEWKKQRQHASPVLFDILDRFTLPDRGVEYCSSLKDFSFQLDYYSPRAYKFVRESFGKKLPHPKTLPRYSSHVDVRPGFLFTSLKFIQQRVDENKQKLQYSLSFDEMSIRKQIVSDGSRLQGFLDYGGIIEVPEKKQAEEATSALFILATEINGSFRIPIGYILTKGLEAGLLSEVIKASLTKMSEFGASVLSITFDGLPANFSAAEKLGARLDPFCDDVEDFKPFIPHPVTSEKVYVFPDPVHMIKLLRNAWKKHKVFIDKDGNKIEWRFLQQLIDLQTEEGLHAANKLSSRHLNFEQQVMKVRYATQTFSSSVGVALEFCQKLGLPQFQGVEATVRFIKLMDKLFDTMNSRPCGRGYKSPLSLKNRSCWESTFKEASTTLLTLEVFEVKKGKLPGKVFLRNSKRSTCVTGFFTGIGSLSRIMNEVVSNPQSGLRYLPVYKLSQDVIELFFATIRSRFGHNNNPNVVQLAAAVRKVLCMKLLANPNGNCMDFEAFATRISPLGNFKSIRHEASEIPSLEEDQTEEQILPSTDVTALTDFVGNIVVYIAGFISRRLSTKISCGTCSAALSCSKKDEGPEALSNDRLFLRLKDNGGLFHPTNDVVEICKIAESEIRSSQQNINKLKRDEVVRKVLLKVSRQNFFQDLKTTASEEHPRFSDHTLELMKQIATEYCKIRIHYIAKQSTLRLVPESKRNKCNKIVLFSGN